MKNPLRESKSFAKRFSDQKRESLLQLMDAIFFCFKGNDSDYDRKMLGIIREHLESRQISVSAETARRYFYLAKTALEYLGDKDPKRKGNWKKKIDDKKRKDPKYIDSIMFLGVECLIADDEAFESERTSNDEHWQEVFGINSDLQQDSMESFGNTGNDRIRKVLEFSDIGEKFTPKLIGTIEDILTKRLIALKFYKQGYEDYKNSYESLRDENEILKKKGGEKVRGRFLKLSKKYAQVFKATRENAFYSLINRQGNEITELKKELCRWKDIADTAIQTNDVLMGESKKYKKDFEFFESYIMELESDLNLSVEDEQETPDDNCQDKNGNSEHYEFPAICCNPEWPIEYSVSFTESFEKLPKNIKKKVVKRLGYLQEIGLGGNSLSPKKRHDGKRQMYIDRDYRAFWELVEGKIVFNQIAHKNSL